MGGTSSSLADRKAAHLDGLSKAFWSMLGKAAYSMVQAIAIAERPEPVAKHKSRRMFRLPDVELFMTESEEAALDAADSRWEEQRIWADYDLRVREYVRWKRTIERIATFRRNTFGRGVEPHIRRAPGDLTDELWSRIKRAFDYRCAYCGDGETLLVIEHVVPVILGGRTNWNNVVPACRTCNAMKRSKSPEIWLSDPELCERFCAAVMRANEVLT